MTDSVVNRHVGRFVAELVLVVAGILLALAIDGWVNDAHDRKSETVYLEFLARDIQEIRQRAELQIEFERNQIETGAKAYGALSALDPATNKVELRRLLGTLSVRQTLILSSATYNQMVSSGHLQLIRNKTFRDSLVRYFDRMERIERVAERNNRDLIDLVYTPFLMRAGISVDNESTEPNASLSQASRIVDEYLGKEIVYPEDRVLSESPDADSWNDIRRNVLFRTRISAVGLSLAKSIVEESDAIAIEVADELGGG
jgi:hypothetical protein